MPDGDYYVRVVEPGGGQTPTVLGESVGATLTITGGLTSCPQLITLVADSNDNPGFDDTTNPGNNYVLEISQDATFPTGGGPDALRTYTDLFHVEPAIPPQGTLSVIKFYDANADGLNNDAQLITGWRITIDEIVEAGIGFNVVRFTPVTETLDNGNYTVAESPSTVGNWVATTPTSFSPVIITGGQTTSVVFGNLCLGGGGGKTHGFWGNKNGGALVGEDDLAALVALNLRNANGSAFDPASYAAYKSWNQAASATNMAYMLSAQLAAMQLNVLNGFVTGSPIIQAPGTDSANSLGFALLSAVMTEANNSLGANGLTLSGDAQRARQEALKNALDRANNNLNFVQGEPCSFAF